MVKYKKKNMPKKRVRKYKYKNAKVFLKVGKFNYRFHDGYILKSDALREQKKIKFRGENCIIRERRSEGRKIYLLYTRS